jgi:glycosyltransferase 2 family protein
MVGQASGRSGSQNQIGAGTESARQTLIMAENQVDKKRWQEPARALLKALVSAILVFWLLRRIGIGSILDHFQQASWRWLIISLTVFTVSNVLGALQWHLLLDNRGVRLTLRHSLWLYHIGLFFNNFLLGNVGGDAFRIYDIRRLSNRTDAAFSTVFLDRFIGFFALSSLALLVAAFMIFHLLASSAVYAIVLIFSSWVLALLFLFFEGFAVKFAWLFRWILPPPIHIKAKAFYYSLNAFRHEKKLLYRVFALSLIIQTLRILTHWSAARALTLNVSPGYFFLFIPIVALLAGLPISLGGLGVREQSAVTLFGQIGIPSAQIVAFEVLAYLVGIIATLPGGILFVLRKKTP